MNREELVEKVASNIGDYIEEVAKRAGYGAMSGLPMGYWAKELSKSNAVGLATGLGIAAAAGRQSVIHDQIARGEAPEELALETLPRVFGSAAIFALVKAMLQHGISKAPADIAGNALASRAIPVAGGVGAALLADYLASRARGRFESKKADAVIPTKEHVESLLR